MKLWIDEDLSPSLVEVAHRHGLDATCNRDRGLLGRSDVEVLARCIEEDRTLVTNNYGDFRRLCEAHTIHRSHHPPHARTRDQQQLLDHALGHLTQQSTRHLAADHAEIMINRVVEVNETGACADFSLPVPR